MICIILLHFTRFHAENNNINVDVLDKLQLWHDTNKKFKFMMEQIFVRDSTHVFYLCISNCVGTVNKMEKMSMQARISNIVSYSGKFPMFSST